MGKIIVLKLLIYIKMYYSYFLKIKLSIEEEKKEPVIEGKQLEINDFLEEDDKGNLRPYQLSFTKL